MAMKVKKVPLRRCKRCVRFRSSMCPLNDLDPCSYVTNRKEFPLRLVVAFILGVGLLLGFILA